METKYYWWDFEESISKGVIYDSGIVIHYLYKALDIYQLNYSGILTWKIKHRYSLSHYEELIATF